MSFKQMLSGPGGPRMQMDLVYGTRVPPSHWQPQTDVLLVACHMWPSLRAVRSESLKQGLDELVGAANAHRRADAPALPLPSNTSAFASINVLEYVCPWQCYFQLCGDACMDGMLKHYVLDVLHLGYPVPRSVDDLWLAERQGCDTSELGAARLAALPPQNRSAACLTQCKVGRNPAFRGVLGTSIAKLKTTLATGGVGVM